MNLTQNDLSYIYCALGLAIDELHNQIVTCPDIYENAEALNELETEQDLIGRLRVRIGNHIMNKELLK
jgi:hypothetical protein